MNFVGEALDSRTDTGTDNGHPRPFPAIPSHPRPSTAITYIPGYTPAIPGHPRPCGKCMGTLGVVGGHLYELWEVYGDLMVS